MLPFYALGFLVLSAGIEWEHWPEMGQNKQKQQQYISW